MLIIPAIDLKDGKCVRLLRGAEGTETVFSSDPVGVARDWENSGAPWIHVVDLDGAFTGSPKNFDVIKQITRTVSCSVQVGGGIRDLETVKSYIDSGVKRVVIGTAAFQDRDFLVQVCKSYAGMVAVGIDTKSGRVAIKGWTEVINGKIDKIISELESIGVSLIIHTNVDKDGTLEGVDIDPIKKFISLSSIPVVASGGIAKIEDIEKLSTLEEIGLHGVILGKSIYTNSINLKDAIKRFS